MAEEIEDVEVEVKEDTMSKVLDRIEAIEKRIAGMEEKVKSLESELEKAKKPKKEEKYPMPGKYPYPPKYPYAKKSEDGLTLEEWVDGVNEVLKDITESFDEFREVHEKSLKEIDERVKSLEDTPEFETEEPATDEEVAKFRDKSIIIDRGMIYRV